MLVDASLVLRDLDEKPIVLEDVTLTLGLVCVRVLLNPLEGDPRFLPAEETVGRFELARRLHAGGTVEITPEQASLLRERVCKAWSIIIGGQACMALG